MKKVKVSEATGPVLDWMVAKAEGALAPVGNLYFVGRQLFVAVGGDLGPLGEWVLYTPSTDWAQGGPITERQGIATRRWLETGWEADKWNFKFDERHMNGPTKLIAAMRCYVASKLGDEVEVPEELLTD